MARRFVLFGLAAALAAAACVPVEEDAQGAAAADEGPRECFYASHVGGFSEGPADNQIYVRTGPSDVYLFETFGGCRDLDFARQIAFDQRIPGAICRGLDVDLLVPTPGGLQRCPVRMIRRLSEAEEEAL